MQRSGPRRDCTPAWIRTSPADKTRANDALGRSQPGLQHPTRPRLRKRPDSLLSCHDRPLVRPP